MTEGRTSRAQIKRDAIYTAAQHLFLQTGFEGTSMDAIALEARVSKQTLYRYYQNKEALFIAVLEHLALHQPSESSLHILQALPMERAAALEHALTLWSQATVTNLMQPAYLGLLRLLIAELPRFPQLSSLFLQAIPQQGGAFLLGLLENARRHGVLVVDDLELVLRLLVGSLLTYVFADGLLTTEQPPHAPAPERVAALVRLALAGVVRNAGKEGE